MATLKFKPDELLKKMRIKKYAVDQMISEGKGGSPGTPTPDWDKNWPGKGTRPRPEDRPKTAMDFQDALPRGGFVGTSRTNVFINDGGEAYILKDGDFKFDGMYDPARHGPVFPQAKAQDGMKIAKKKRNEQRAYEDFVRDSQNMPLDESFKDLRRGQDGEGFDILRDILDLDKAKNNATDGLKIAHHTGGKHFTEPSMDELIKGIIKGDIPRGTLGDEETENRMIQEYLNKQKQSLKIGKA